MNNHYNKKLKSYARTLRKESVSIAEKRIWKAVLSRNQLGVKFKRQRPIGKFIVDFFAGEIGLVVEIDGSSHHSKGENDQERENELKSMGYTIIRFQEGEVIYQLEDVYNRLNHAVYCLKNES